jgi:hypothetical protein
VRAMLTRDLRSMLSSMHWLLGGAASRVVGVCVCNHAHVDCRSDIVEDTASVVALPSTVAAATRET